MLKLIYDVRVGFDDLYVTEKNIEYELDSMFDRNCLNIPEEDNKTVIQTAEEFYEEYKEDVADLEEWLEATRIMDNIIESTEVEAAHTYFNHICFADKNNPFIPTCQKIYNLRLVYDPTVEVTYESESDSSVLSAKYAKKLKAKDVMAILGVSRQTVSNYVKTGKLKVTSRYDGGQYIYDYDSVMALKGNK